MAEFGPDAQMDGPEGGELTRLFEKIAHPSVCVVEVGCFKCGTTHLLSDLVKPYNGKVYAVDTWPDIGMFNWVREYFRKCGITNTNFMVMSSLEAANIFRYGSCDLVFIDADHRHSMVKMDIEAWLPIVKQGGILCGHDCEKKFTEWRPDQQIDIIEHAEDDKGLVQCHPGVIRALYEIFQDDYDHWGPGRIWAKQL